MSNTDGEDIERCKFNCDGPKSELDQFCGCWNELHQELASLREQLKQKDEIIKELIPIAERAIYYDKGVFEYTNDPSDKAEIEEKQAIIEKAKSLTTKDK